MSKKPTQDDKLKALVERFWNDVAGLPWQDPNWVNNPGAKEETRQHYVTATYFDLLKIVNGEDEKDNAKE